MKISKCLVFFLALHLCFILTSSGQTPQERFGKNRIQHRVFKWQRLSTLNFDIYYYEEGKDLAFFAADYAEKEFSRISNFIGFSPYSKIRVIVYNSTSDLHQSNLGMDESEIVVGGQTSFVKSNVEVGYRGTRKEFQEDLSSGIASILINIMMYGGNLKEIVQSSYLLNLPEWYINGAAAYIAKGWDVQMDDKIRNLLIEKKIRKPGALTGEDAVIAGHSIWNYLVIRYGESFVASLLNLTRILKNDESGLESTIGMPEDIFYREWRNYYKSMATDITGPRIDLVTDSAITKNKKESYIRDVKFSNDGQFSAWVENNEGKYKIRLRNILKERTDNIFHAGYKNVNQVINTGLPVLEWRNENVLCWFTTIDGDLKLYFYDRKTGRKKKRLFKDVSAVHSFSFSPDGNLMLMSAVQKGKTDIFLYDIDKYKLTKVTDDDADDIFPVFTTKGYFFSSNKQNTPDSTIRPNYRIVQLSKGKRIEVFSEGNSFNPVLFKDSLLFFLNDKEGIVDLYKKNLNTGKVTKVTNFLYNISFYDISPNGDLVLTAVDKGRTKVFLYRKYNFSQKFEYVPTQRIKILSPEVHTADSLNFNSNQEVNQDLDLNEFRFESEVKKEKEPAQPQDNNKNQVKVRGPLRYQHMFSADEITTTLLIDPIRGLGVLMEARMSDMMGHHKMRAGIFGLSDFKNSNFYGEYQYLERRTDFKFYFRRNTYNLLAEDASQRYTLNKAEVTASYPISVTQRITGGPIAAFTRYTDYVNFFLPDTTRFYTGLKGEYVMDNTRNHGLNMIQGTRGKVMVEYYVHPGGSNANFGKIRIDLRHYQKIHKDIILAGRVFYGAFFGNSKKNFMIGGMDNWLFNQTRTDAPNNPLQISNLKDNSDILFAEFVFPLRGYIYNTQFGPKSLLFNAELRVPLVKYLYNGAINSNFFRNFQVVGFTDAGTAWTGANPFSKNNSINTTLVSNGPFSATVRNYINPFLIGYGFGARSMLLGYYVKFDVAWGLLDSVVQKRRFYLTFGYDF